MNEMVIPRNDPVMPREVFVKYLDVRQNVTQGSRL